ncbi:MAG: hypothetical protein GF346_11470, partial [Candidatus Eisenbacteria bacterium]|nr:hypothetical protein [Candidatus Latescibacterota bacterium]MBD3303055.1 hypothetical protein [Candidatus Eisenbacteria bacterium]
LRRVAADELRLDLPAMQSRLASDADTTPSREPPAEGGGGVPWLRDGPLPGIPSVAAESLSVTAPRIRIAEDRRIEPLILGGRFDLRAGGASSIQIDRLQGELPDDSLSIDGGEIFFDPAAPRLVRARLDGRLGPDWPIHLRARTEEDGAVRISLLRTLEVPPPRGTGLLVEGTLQRTTGPWSRFEGTVHLRVPETEELARIPILRPALAGVPSVEPLSTRISGSFDWGEALRGDLRIAFDPGERLRHGSARVRLGPGSVAVDSARIAYADLSLQGEIRDENGRRDGAIEIEVSGTQWLEPFADEGAIPDSLAARIVARLGGTVDEPEIAARIEGGARFGGFALDDLSFTAAGDPDERIRFRLAARSGPQILDGSGILHREEPLRLESPPWRFRLVEEIPADLRVADAGAPDAAPKPSAETGTVTFASETGKITADNVRIEGDLGRLTVGGRYDEAGGRLRVGAAWPEPPAPLLQAVASDSAGADSLRRSWGAGGPFRVESEIRLESGTEGMIVRADAELRLPGPSALTPLLPPAAAVSDLGPLLGTARFESAPDADGTRWTGSLDLGETDWIDTLRVEGSGSADRIALDTLRIRILDLSARGSVDAPGPDLSGDLRLRVEGGRLLRRFAAVESTEVSIDLNAEISGSRERPVVRAGLAGAVRRPGFSLDGLRGDLLYRSADRLQTQIRLTEGIALGPILLDSAAVRLGMRIDEREGQARHRGRATVELDGPDLHLLAEADVAETDGWRLAVDTLSLGIRGETLEAARTFHVELLGDTTRVRDLRMEGTLGSLEGRAALLAERLDLLLDADLVLPDRPILPGIPPGLWPRDLRARVHAAPNDSVAAWVEATGLRVGPEDELTLRLDLRDPGERIRGELRLLAGEKGLLRVSGSYPVHVRTAPFGIEPLDEAFDLRVRARDFPLPAAAGNPLHTPGYLGWGEQTRGPRLAAESIVRGRPAEPVALFSGTVTFPEYEELKRYSVEIRARGLPAIEVAALEEAAPGDVATDSLLAVVGALPAIRPGLSARILGSRGEKTLFEGELSLPIDWGFRPGAGTELPDEPMRLSLRSDGLRLGDFTPLIPDVQRISGQMRFDIGAEGPVSDPALSGSLRIEDLQVLLPDGTRATAKGKADLSGTAQAPAVDGKITIQNGRIQVPDAPRELHPVEGEALLWAKADTLRIAPERAAVDDTLAAERSDPAGTTKVGPPAPGERTGTVFNLRVDIPSGVWLTGRGLEVELTGNLHVAQRDGSLALVGTLQAERGEMNFHGRKLTIQEGSVTFYGSSDLNPSLDLTLVKQEEDVTVRVLITGTLESPCLTLESVPEMTQADILSFLIFGKRSGTLNSEQSARLEDRALATAEQFAASRLATEIGREVGIDMVEYESSQSDSLGRGVTIGKYLSPNLLVKYEQNLEDAKDIGVVIEYYLGRGFRLEMHSRRYEQDGMILNWEKDY